MPASRWAAAVASVAGVHLQLLGALGRIAAGRWADHIGSRMRPVRKIAVAAGYPLAFAASAVFPLAAVPLIPARAHDRVL